MNDDAVLFFSRGQGRGHAVPDVAVVEDLMHTDPNCRVLFVSYSTGAATIRELGHTVIDLELPERNPIWETVVRVTRLIFDKRPLLVVAHEELCAMPAAKIYNIPTVFITDWLPGSEDIECLSYADDIICIDDPGYFDVSPSLVGKIHYVGQVFRPWDRIPLEKSSARSELGISSDSLVILVIPGGSEIEHEDRSPICDLVVSAHDRLEAPTKCLIWIADGRDYELLSERTKHRRDIMIQRPDPGVYVKMMACDLGITKGNRETSFELAALGIPSISLSFGKNPIDDYRVAHIPTNRAVRARGIDSVQLKELMVQGIARGCIPVRLDLISRGRRATAERLLEHLQRARSYRLLA
jgi:UDP-N-acetylglucosamine:LPS N-acetylglucosamine transferase